MTTDPWATWITEETIVRLHADCIKRWGGAGSAPKPGCLEQCLGCAYHAALYAETSEVERGLAFCGYALLYISTNHCFVDGNKRLAWATAMYVLLQFGLTVNASDDEAEQFCLALARSDIKSGQEVIRWLAEHLESV